jgi:hypothetical protein
MGIPLEGMKIIRGPGSKPYLSYEKTLPKGIDLHPLERNAHNLVVTILLEHIISFRKSRAMGPGSNKELSKLRKDSPEGHRSG